MGAQPTRRGLGVGGKAGKELPDLSIHPPLSLVHLGDRERKEQKTGIDGQKDMREAIPCPRLHQPHLIPPLWASHMPLSTTLSVRPLPSHS